MCAYSQVAVLRSFEHVCLFEQIRYLLSFLFFIGSTVCNQARALRFFEEVEAWTSLTAQIRPSIFLDKTTTKIAKTNWNYWFNFFEGRRVIKEVLNIKHLFSNDFIHEKLGTGSFKRITEAGICFDRERARTLVNDQLQEFVIVYQL